MGETGLGKDLENVLAIIATVFGILIGLYFLYKAEKWLTLSLI